MNISHCISDRYPTPHNNSRITTKQFALPRCFMVPKAFPTDIRHHTTTIKLRRRNFTTVAGDYRMVCWNRHGSTHLVDDKEQLREDVDAFADFNRHFVEGACFLHHYCLVQAHKGVAHACEKKKENKKRTGQGSGKERHKQ